MTIYSKFYKIEDWLFDIKMWLQKKFRGYSDVELWNLDWTFAKWMLPKLKMFREKTIGFPFDFATLEDWQAAIDDMIFSFEFFLRDLPSSDKDIGYMRTEQYKKDLERYNRGKELFGKYWPHLWW